MKPFLVEDPCHVGWDSMTRDVGARHCASCDKHVIDIARLTESELRGVITLMNGQFCGHQTIRNGALVLAPEVTPLRSRSPFSLRALFGGAAALSALAACAPAHASEPATIVDDGTPMPTPSPIEVAPVMQDDLPDGLIDVPFDDVRHEVVTFAKGSAVVEGESLKRLERVAAMLKHFDWIKHVGITGGSTSDEKPGLGLARAEAVRAKLVELGVKQSLATNAHAPGDPKWTTLRRVQFLPSEQIPR